MERAMAKLDFKREAHCFVATSAEEHLRIVVNYERGRFPAWMARVFQIDDPTQRIAEFEGSSKSDAIAKAEDWIWQPGEDAI
jgi:hypothetical protein